MLHFCGDYRGRGQAHLSTVLYDDSTGCPCVSVRVLCSHYVHNTLRVCLEVDMSSHVRRTGVQQDRHLRLHALRPFHGHDIDGVGRREQHFLFRPREKHTKKKKKKKRRFAPPTKCGNEQLHPEGETERRDCVYREEPVPFQTPRKSSRVIGWCPRCLFLRRCRHLLAYTYETMFPSGNSHGAHSIHVASGRLSYAEDGDVEESVCLWDPKKKKQILVN
jgi:hypothetical protein